MKKIQEIAFPPPTKEEIRLSISIGILRNENEIMQYRYKKHLEAIKESKGYAIREGKGYKLHELHPVIENYDESIFEENTIEEYMKAYPLRFDKDLGIYKN